MKINLPLDYIVGYLRYGHLEGEIDYTEEEEKEFKNLLKKSINNENEMSDEEWDKLETYQEEIRDNCTVIIDDYCLEECGPCEWSALLDDENNSDK